VASGVVINIRESGSRIQLPQIECGSMLIVETRVHRD
jgi:hypothetical protein